MLQPSARADVPTGLIPSTRAGGRLSRLEVIGYGAGDAANNVAFQMPALFLLIYYTDVVGISAVTAGTIMFVVKAWEAVCDLLAGRMVDRTMTRWGKFRPFILFGAPPLLLLNVAVFSVPQVDSPRLQVTYAVVSYGLLALAYTMVNIPYGSMAGAITQLDSERSRLSAARMVGSGVTILLLSVVLAPRLTSSDDLQGTFTAAALVFVVVGLALFGLCFVTARETVERDVARVGLRAALTALRRNRALSRLCLATVLYLSGQSMIAAGALYYAREVLGDGGLGALVTVVTTGAVIYVGLLAPLIVRSFGKKRSFVGAGFTAAAGCLALRAVPASSTGAQIAALAVVGFGMAVLNTMTWTQSAEAVEYGEWKTRIRAEGATYSVFSFTRKVGQATGAAVFGFALAAGGYATSGADVGAQQPEGAIDAIVLGMTVMPSVLFVLAAVVMATHPLDEATYRSMLTEIRDRRAGRAGG